MWVCSGWGGGGVGHAGVLRVGVLCVCVWVCVGRVGAPKGGAPRGGAPKGVAPKGGAPRQQSFEGDGVKVHFRKFVSRGLFPTAVPQTKCGQELPARLCGWSPRLPF